MQIVDAKASHLDAIRAITTDVIATTTAIYDDDPPTCEEAEAWWRAKQEGGLPVLVAIEGERVLGFASYGPYNSKSGYRFTVEHSLHVDAAQRGRGVGHRLLEAIEARARKEGKRTLVGLIDADNAASRHLHESCGFTLGGTLPDLGYKFERWLSVCYYYKRLGD
ncbi:MAG: N-acetyltransferase family protein [Planctomycetota bacterium]